VTGDCSSIIPEGNAMLYAAHTRAPPLAEFVEYFWALSDVPPHARERILPSGTLELVVNLNEDEFRIYDRLHPERFRRLSGAIVSGAYGGYFVIDTLEHASVIGVHFKPGGAPAVLGIPAGALADAHADLQTLRRRPGFPHPSLEDRRRSLPQRSGGRTRRNPDPDRGSGRQPDRAA